MHVHTRLSLCTDHLLLQRPACCCCCCPACHYLISLHAWQVTELCVCVCVCAAILQLSVCLSVCRTRILHEKRAKKTQSLSELDTKVCAYLTRKTREKDTKFARILQLFPMFFGFFRAKNCFLFTRFSPFVRTKIALLFARFSPFSYEKIVPFSHFFCVKFARTLHESLRILDTKNSRKRHKVCANFAPFSYDFRLFSCKKSPFVRTFFAPFRTKIAPFSHVFSCKVCANLTRKTREKTQSLREFCTKKGANCVRFRTNFTPFLYKKIAPFSHVFRFCSYKNRPFVRTFFARACASARARARCLSQRVKPPPEKIIYYFNRRCSIAMPRASISDTACQKSARSTDSPTCSSCSTT